MKTPIKAAEGKNENTVTKAEGKFTGTIPPGKAGPGSPEVPSKQQDSSPSILDDIFDEAVDGTTSELGPVDRPGDIDAEAVTAMILGVEDSIKIDALSAMTDTLHVQIQKYDNLLARVKEFIHHAEKTGIIPMNQCEVRQSYDLLTK